MKIKQFMMFGAALGLSSVLIGAFASHGLKHLLSVKSLGWMTTAASYQMYHALAILAVGVLMMKVGKNSLLLTSGYSFSLGVLLFSGSLYVLALIEMGVIPSLIKGYVVFMIPAGGVALIIGWLSLFLAASKLTES
jgi:uncharacterized membrane protein YgdD (TMEM256/DUF423 family)